jgi:hypothetical protein
MLRPHRAARVYDARCSPSPCLRACPLGRGHSKDPHGEHSLPRHSRTQQLSLRRRAQCVFGDSPNRPLTAGAPSPRVDPRCSARELHVFARARSNLAALRLRCSRARDLRVYHVFILKLREILNFRKYAYRHWAKRKI